MLTKKQNLTREILTVILLLAAVAATEYWFFQLWRLDWHVPMFYGGDGIYWVGQVQRSYGELSGSLGWPFYEVAGRYDPNYDLIYDIFVWFVGLFTKDTGTVFNLYVLVIPFANALAGYVVFRMVGLRRWLSFAFGLTFGLTPYVQQRMAGHMMLAACEFVPFSVLLCLWCAEDEQFNRPGRGFFKNKRNWLALAMAWGIANNGAAYYPYFTCFFLCVTALCLILRDRRWRAGTSCVVTIAEIVAWMIPDFFPMVLGILNGQGSTLTNGVYRSPVGADIYSLRISSLLLSPNGFGLQKLANWMGRYFHVLATDEGPMYNENAYGYLGIVGIFGFLALLFMLLAGIIGGLIAGPELSAMADTVLRSLRDEPGYWWETYRRVWKRNARESLVPGILTGLVLSIQIFTLFHMSVISADIVTWVLLILSFVVTLGLESYIWPQIALLDLPL